MRRAWHQRSYITTWSQVLLEIVHPQKAKPKSTLAGSRETKSRRPPVQDLYDRMKAYLKAYDHTKLSIMTQKQGKVVPKGKNKAL